MNFDAFKDAIINSALESTGVSMMQLDDDPTREKWLDNAVFILEWGFNAIGAELDPLSLRVSCGFPLGKRSAIGQAWSSKASSGGRREIFISPTLDEPTRVLDVLIHELCHAALDNDGGHGPKFRKLALACGLCGPMRSTEATPELRDLLHAIAMALGPYPHAKLTPLNNEKKKPGSRLVKLMCDPCGMVIRTTQKWLDQPGAPTCACGGAFVDEETAEEMSADNSST